MIDFVITNGIVLLDEADLSAVLEHNWYAVRKGNKIYACTTLYDKNRSSKRYKLYMHRYLKGAIKGETVDHVNGDGMDNTRCNLRKCSKAENARNSELSASNTSGYKGVTWNKNAKKWLAQLKVDRRHVYIGVFTDILDAAKAYNTAALEHFGEFARLNVIKV